MSLVLSCGVLAQDAAHPHAPRIPPRDRADAPTLNDLAVTPNLGRATLVLAEAAEKPGADGDTETAPVGHRLLLPSGSPFHHTVNTVEQLQTIAVPGGSTQIYLWREVNAKGQRQDFYAVSPNGKSLLGEPRVFTSRVRLLGHEFDPLEEAEPQPFNQLRARADNRLFLVQFAIPPLPAFRDTIGLYGGEILRFLPDHTFLVAMKPATRFRVNRLPYVRWVGAYHPEYRLEPELRQALKGAVAPLGTARYSIMLGKRDQGDQVAVASAVEALGGTMVLHEDGGLRVEALLSQDQLLEVAHLNQVQYIDRWGGPGETDMDVVRQVGGADYLETIEGWSGQGVRGEIFDTELLTSHQEWPGAPLLHSTGTSSTSYHGTSCYSINFAQGTDPDARGMLPSGQGIFFRHSESSQFGGGTSRYDINQELIDPAGPYRAVFQTSSVGSSRTTSYTTISAEVDDYLFVHQILSTQSQSNAGTRQSRPQAWSKNIVSVGGMYHYGTASRDDDHWGGGASIGPASDGRYKPDLAYFYDGIYSARGTGNTSYTGFGGTSAATPETAGHFGLLFQMWHEGTWSGHGGGASVFDSRPQMATAKALMINAAYRYDWNAGGANADIDRNKQGWGTADLQRLYDRAPNTRIIDETDLLTPLGTNSYTADVASGETELNITLAYTDPMGTVGAAVQRVNDLSLRVVSPSGTVYWGNNGLGAGNVSTPGGSADTRNTVENVFIQNPEAGPWIVEVRGDEIVADAHVETAEVDADYGLVISGAGVGDPPGGPDYMGLPNFSRTYSNGTRTRGFFFTAPTDFVITGLQVPDEQGHGSQHVEVVRFDGGATPPTYSAVTNGFSSLFRSTGSASASVISTNIPVFAGDVIGILGAAGDTSIMHNSYGDLSPFNTTILGQPTTLNRLGMQFNLAGNTARDLWTADGAIARVKMFYAPMEQAEAPLPDFSRTYANATRTRGYYFTAPRDFTIVGLQVPDETGHGSQNVEVIRFDPGVTPPTFSATTNAFTSLFRQVGVASNQVLTTSISVQAGEVIGILGAAGDGGMMHNSYGAGGFTSEIFGSSFTMTRLGMQFNLASNAAQSVWTNTGDIARVKMFYAE